jgi:CO dehydrogenase/acetyl-CoA synthase epsilon subunit
MYAQQILDKAHPCGVVDGMGDYDGVVNVTGLRCTVLEEALKAKRVKFGKIRKLRLCEVAYRHNADTDKRICQQARVETGLLVTSI